MSLEDLYEFAEDFQSIIGGLFAFAGVLIGVHFLRKQAGQAHEHELHRRERKAVAARALLPALLAAITEHTAAAARLLRPAYAETLKKDPEQGQGVLDPRRLTKIDHEVFRSIGHTIEADATRGVEQALSAMAYRLQILEARMQHLANPGPHTSIVPANVASCLADCAIIQTWAALLLRYGRKQVDEVAVEQFGAEAENSLGVLELTDHREALMQLMHNDIDQDGLRAAAKLPALHPGNVQQAS